MFELVTGEARHMPRHQGWPLLISTAAQVSVATAALTVPLLYVTDTIPDVPTMMAFVAAPPPPPPPPPPPAPARPAAKAARPDPAPGRLAAPVEAQPTVEPEPVATFGDEEGVPGGVEGGVPGGVIGGVVGGIPDLIPPPAPPPPPAPRTPLRIGGQLQAPALLKRVDPEYPLIAQHSNLEGLVILEALINEEGAVEEVKVLRSAGHAGVLDRPAVAALKQWQYTPLLLNGRRERFILTVTLSFTLQDRR